MNWIDILSVIISVLNFVFVVIVFFKDNKDRMIERENSYKMSWFNRLDIDKIINNLNIAYTKVEEEINKIVSENDSKTKLELIRKSINDFNNYMITEKEKISDISYCLNQGSDNKVILAFSNALEAYGVMIQGIFIHNVSNFEKIKNDLNKTKNEIIKAIYNMGKSYI